jgi:hypothetical protein
MRNAATHVAGIPCEPQALCVKKPLAVFGLVLVVIFGLAFSVGGATYAAYRDNRTPCAAPLEKGATDGLGIELPDGVRACRKLARTESTDLELVVEAPGPLCFASMGQLACPSIVKNQLAFMSAMTRAGWDTGDARGKDEITFRRGKGESASVRFRSSRYGEIAATMTVFGRASVP